MEIVLTFVLTDYITGYGSIYDNQTKILYTKKIFNGEKDSKSPFNSVKKFPIAIMIINNTIYHYYNDTSYDAEDQYYIKQFPINGGCAKNNRFYIFFKFTHIRVCSCTDKIRRESDQW